MIKEEFPIEITEKAREEIIKAIKEDEQENLSIRVLRIAIQGGGCSGLQYKMDFDDNKREDDYSLDIGNGNVVVIDGHSAVVLRGTTLDYQTALVASGFKFINPNAKKHCGCGSSFGV